LTRCATRQLATGVADCRSNLELLESGMAGLTTQAHALSRWADGVSAQPPTRVTT